jgi:molybdate transport system substrate-binding protein
MHLQVALCQPCLKLRLESLSFPLVPAVDQPIVGRPVAEDVAKGLVEVGLQQINVIIPVEGADYVGPLPKELQETVKFAGGVLTVSKEPEFARAFLRFIASPEAAALIRKSAMEPWS